METFTTSYEFSHGRKPRGHGTWIFEAQFGGPAFTRTTEITVEGMYGKARAEAARKATAMGARAIRVMP